MRSHSEKHDVFPGLAWNRYITDVSYHRNLKSVNKINDKNKRKESKI